MAAGDRCVFAYGSLMQPGSVLRTLAHRSAPPAAAPFVLHGWRRSWDVVSARTFALAGDPTGPIHRRLVLGLTADPDGACQGLVLRLTEPDVAALVGREAAYQLAEVGDVAGDGAGEAVWTFVPREGRRLGAVPVAEPLVVERAYLHECLDGATAHGLAAAAREIDAARTGLRLADATS
ncbi:gamma-glutamylcyclotransferase family protein [Aquihabitans sp. McL0605]|uniref:gamma-glutamylcyclotransferase family protein n=1 Tax=Aquihabitans sp. McL0605 TaxID=3415671 RepID=UPI003CF08459